MPIKVGGFAQSKMDGAEDPNFEEVLSNDSINGTDQSEVVVDKYSGEEFEIERNSDFITILPHIITPEGCEHIIEQFINLPFSECEYADSQVTPPKEIEDRNLSYKYEADHNKDHATIADGSKEYNAVLDVMGHLIPDHPDFRRITYMQIVHYKEDSFFPFHRDVAEDTDFGTCIMQLNDGYQGGQLNVQGNLIAKDIGTITFFNNSTKMWHGVEPIYEGQRFVLLIWFGREEHGGQ
jgi:hypothetical protein